MADEGPPAPPATVPPVPFPIVPPVQLPIPPIQPIVPPAQPIPPQLIQPTHVPQLNWPHFKPGFMGKPDEDVEVHLLRMNDLMDTHAFQEVVKIQHFA